MNVPQMDKDKGMFFIFESEGTYPFWMKNTLIPLDIIWIDNRNKIVYIAENAQPCPASTLICPSISPLGNAKYVLEINGGLCQALGIKAGDEVSIKN